MGRIGRSRLRAGPEAPSEGPKTAATVARIGSKRPEIDKRNGVRRFEVLPRRWIVAPAFAWFKRNRCLASDLERHVQSVVAFIRLAMIRIMLRKPAATHSQ